MLSHLSKNSHAKSFLDQFYLEDSFDLQEAIFTTGEKLDYSNTRPLRHQLCQATKVPTPLAATSVKAEIHTESP